MFVGQLEKHKGIQWLIDFWRRNNIVHELFVVGGGSPELTNLPTNVKLLGKKIGQELNTIFTQIDFLIMPSLCYENSPTVIPLAYQNATPVIVANIGGAGELVKQNETGYLFESGDNDSLMEALKQVDSLGDEEYKRMSENCLAAVKDFPLQKYVDKLLLP